ncbi:MAG TPA: PAS domain S-box protein [Syntrophobacteraceae bacterium]|nr:PAS domain S-box protein [Syntrophobacteraceae bacterium]
MKIKKRLMLNIYVSIGAILLMMLSLAWSFSEAYKAGRNLRLTDELRKAGIHKISLRDDYLLHREERARAQWYAKSETFRKLLESACERFESKEDRALLDNARNDFDSTFYSFSEILERDRLDEHSEKKGFDFDEAELRLISQVFLRAYALNDDIDMLHESARRAWMAAWSRGVVLIILFIVCGVIAMVVNTAFIGRILVERVAAIVKGIGIIGGGNLDYRIETTGDDELSALALASNEMAAKLKDSYTSFEDLEKEVAERRRVEETLREANEYLNNLIRYASAPIIVWDRGFRITRFNRAFERLTGRTAGDVIGRHIEILFPPDLVDRSMHLIEKTLLGERWEAVEISILHVDGSVSSVLWNSATIFTRDKKTPIATIAQGQDITRRKQEEAERMHLERQLQQARKAESLGRMAGAIAHHFNNKLMVVSGNLEMALIEAEPNRRLSQRLLDAQHATSQAAEMSGLMLAYLGQTLPKAEIFDLARVCRDVVQDQKSYIPGRVTLMGDPPPDGCTIRANRAQVRQVLSNLIVNAWEAIGDGRGEVHVSLRIVEATETMAPHLFPSDWKPERDLYICLEVSDTGPGINPEELDLIFDPFFSTKFAGRGLGLAVVLGTVRSFGGAIAVESEPGRGSIFRVFWPIAKEEARPVERGRPEVPGPKEYQGIVLFADDEAQVRKMAEVMLARLGFEVILARHGLDALEIFRMRKDEVCLVILDLTMPGMNGWETLGALRALRPDIPIVLSSGYDEAKAMEGEHDELPQAFLHKPYSTADLRAALDVAMGGIVC